MNACFHNHVGDGLSYMGAVIIVPLLQSNFKGVRGNISNAHYRRIAAVSGWRAKDDNRIGETLFKNNSFPVMIDGYAPYFNPVLGFKPVFVNSAGSCCSKTHGAGVRTIICLDLGKKQVSNLHITDFFPGMGCLFISGLFLFKFQIDTFYP